MKVETFHLERMQSTWEHEVEFNLTQSGVTSPLLKEMVTPALLGDTRLAYPQTGGSLRLRQLIARLYPGCGAENVLVGNGTAEPVFLITWWAAFPDKNVVVEVPNWLQSAGIASSLGAEVRTFRLRPNGERWALDLRELEQAVTESTTLIVVSTPNNPTGACATVDEVEGVCAIADRVGAWILADEVYQDATLQTEEAHSFWGRYDRTIITSGLSKAYGLPGLRVGWLIAPADIREELWALKDYTTIGPSVVSDEIAQLVLNPSRRPEVLARTRNLLNDRFRLMAEWISKESALVSLIPPQAGGMAFVRYHVPAGSTMLGERLRKEEGVLVAPGSHFGLDGFFRIGFGIDEEILRSGLERIAKLLRRVERQGRGDTLSVDEIP